MDHRNAPPELECDANHSTHLCYIISQGFNLENEAALRTLVDEPAYQCGHCRRTARSAASLCVPTEL